MGMVTTSLPPNLPPRGLSREQAADYVGVGVTKFDEMVKDGRMPPPIVVDGRRIWDRRELDRAIDVLAGRDAERDSWEDGA